MEVICKTANEGLLARMSPLTLYYTPRLSNEIITEILRKDQLLFRICTDVPARIVRDCYTFIAQHHFVSVSAF